MFALESNSQFFLRQITLIFCNFISRTDSLGTVSPGGLSASSWAPPLSVLPSPTKRSPRPPTESFVSPLNRLVTAAERGDKEDLPLHASNLSSRAIRLTNIAESAAETLKPGTELAKCV